MTSAESAATPVMAFDVTDAPVLSPVQRVHLPLLTEARDPLEYVKASESNCATLHQHRPYRLWLRTHLLPDVHE